MMDNSNTFSWIQRVNLEEINPQFLPSIFVLQRSELPKISWIYFVLSKNGKVNYIGRTNNLKKRWQVHHILDQFKEDVEAKIAWLEVSDRSLLPEIEKALIKWFKPSLNRRSKQRKISSHFRIKRTTAVELSHIAANLGYIYGHGGAVGEMLDAIAKGDLLLIPKENWDKISRKSSQTSKHSLEG